MVAPVSQVLPWWVQNLLTSVFGAVVPLTQLQSDLYSFLLGLAGVVPVEDGSRGIDGSGRPVAVDESVAAQLRLVLQLAGVPGVPVSGACRWTATPRLQCLGGLRHPFSAWRTR